MFEREMMLLEIRKRKEVLASLIEELEQRSLIDLRDCLVNRRGLDDASRNLKKIRKIKKSYSQGSKPSTCLSPANNRKECGL